LRIKAIRPITLMTAKTIVILGKPIMLLKVDAIRQPTKINPK
jgi:hypothetical protein